MKKASSKLIKKVTLRLDDRDWDIVLTHNVLIDCEELTGLNLLTGDVNLLRPSAKVVRAMLFVCLRNAGAKYTLDQVGELIHPQNIQRINEALIIAWAAAMPDPEETENPTKAAE